jgi:hypothetical protein
MPQPVAPINLQIAQQDPSAATGNKQPKIGRSFQTVLKEIGPAQQGQTSAPAQADAARPGGPTQPSAPASTKPVEPPAGTSGARIEQLRLELMERNNQLANDKKTLDQLIPDLSDPKTRRGLLREAMQGIKSPTMAGRDFKGILGDIENRWLGVERTMTSEQDLSTGELLGLQARLYQVAQHVEVVSKVIDQVTGGVKTILNTNI